MANPSGPVSGERIAQMALFMLIEFNDPMMSCLFARFRAAKMLWFTECDSVMVGIRAVGGQVWCDHFAMLEARDIAARVKRIQQAGVRVLVSQWRRLSGYS
ncbi:hypothetical protein [uncultured Actinomyces sp.]|uniref:hypothetical protein n=1 Tax=uncultured Actinomyces sp. TaxID=249061 RepID=UPI002605FC63|nr:hypothetical protein [uncultured Actinomyces sp.]